MEPVMWVDGLVAQGIVYTGPVLTSNGKPHGPAGTLRVSSGPNEGCIISGEFQNGLAHGRCTYEWPDGRVFSGDFVCGRRHGKGTQAYPDGRHYEGDFEDDRVTGQGVERKSNGSVYEGQFYNGCYEGEGMLTLPNGDRYVGLFASGFLHGNGFHYLADGGCYEGRFQGGLYFGAGTLRLPDRVVEGEFIRGKLSCDEGTITWINGQLFRGQFFDGELHGLGEQRYEDGSCYLGRLEQGRRCGSGSLNLVGKYVYAGEFRDNLPCGHGLLLSSDGSSFEGEFLEGMRHGRGSLVLADGTTYEGHFEKDCFHGVGKLVMSDPDAVYEGRFERGAFHGRGTYVQQAGNGHPWLRYSGTFRVGRPCGIGKMESAAGTYEGRFDAAGTRSGFGVYRWASGPVYEGFWHDGKHFEKGLWTWSEHDMKLSCYDKECNFTQSSQDPDEIAVFRRLIARQSAMLFELENQVSCVVCDETAHRSECIACESEHAMCPSCLVDYVVSFCTRAERLQVDKVDLPCGTCSCFYSERDLIRLISGHDAALTEYNKLKEDLVVARVVKEEKAKMQAELERRERLSALDREVEDRSRHIAEEILTLKCPRCRTAFLDFDGCFAVTCATCQAAFCGWCLRDCGEDAHACAMECGRAEGANGYFGTMEQFISYHKRRRQTLLNGYLQQMQATCSPDVLEKVLERCRQDARDLGLIVPASKDFVSNSNPLPRRRGWAAVARAVAARQEAPQLDIPEERRRPWALRLFPNFDLELDVLRRLRLQREDHIEDMLANEPRVPR